MLSTEKISVVNIVFLRLNVTEIHTYFKAFKVDWKKIDKKKHSFCFEETKSNLLFRNIILRNCIIVVF